MNPRSLSATVRIWGQIAPGDMASLNALGIRRLVNNRPDGEEPGQPSSTEIEAAARAAGLDYVSAPIRGRPGPQEVENMAKALTEDVPTLIFCRSGMRSAAAWAMAMTGSGALSPDEAREAALGAGYDLSGLPLQDG